jgi:uncharacterized protein YbaA (DUF1428 family)
MKYVDGFLVVVPKGKMSAYTALAKKAARLWKRHGALEYRECAGDDLRGPCGIPFDKRAAARKGDVVVLAWIVYRSRAHRDRVNAKVMADPRLAAMCSPDSMPFDMARMSHGGFRVFADA